jgi:hypothetical protein
MKVWTPPTTTPNKQHQQQQYCCCCLLLLLPCNIQQLVQHATLDYQWSNHVATRDDHTKTASQGNETWGGHYHSPNKYTIALSLSLSLSLLFFSLSCSAVSVGFFFFFREMIFNPIFQTSWLWNLLPKRTPQIPTNFHGL